MYKVSRFIIVACFPFLCSSCRLFFRQGPNLPLNIAHRGASGARPEHSLEACRLAIEWGADIIELDLIRSKDGVLMVQHDIDLDTTTDIAEIFPSRYAVNEAGEPVDAYGNVVPYDLRIWLPKDFTCAEIQTLLLHERFTGINANRTVSHSFDYSVGTIPTFVESILFIRNEADIHNREVGILVDLKSPQLHRDWGLSLEDELLDVLSSHGYLDETSPVQIQSFEDTSLMALKQKTSIRLIQLIDSTPSILPYGNTYRYDEMLADSGLARIAIYACGICANQNLIVRGTSGKVTNLVSRAHALDLNVYSYVVQNDGLPKYILDLGYRNAGYPDEGFGGYRQMKDLLCAGVDGILTDFSNTLSDFYDKNCLR